MRVLEGRWWKTSSLLGWEGRYSYSNSLSNSSEIFISDLFCAVKIVLKGIMVTVLSVLFCVARFSARPSGAMT